MMARFKFLYAIRRNARGLLRFADPWVLLANLQVGA
jgi:hypothetical protein